MRKRQRKFTVKKTSRVFSPHICFSQPLIALQAAPLPTAPCISLLPKSRSPPSALHAPPTDPSVHFHPLRFLLFGSKDKEGDLTLRTTPVYCSFSHLIFIYGEWWRGGVQGTLIWTFFPCCMVNGDEMVYNEAGKRMQESSLYQTHVILLSLSYGEWWKYIVNNVVKTEH